MLPIHHCLPEPTLPSMVCLKYCPIPNSPSTPPHHSTCSWPKGPIPDPCQALDERISVKDKQGNGRREHTIGVWQSRTDQTHVTTMHHALLSMMPKTSHENDITPTFFLISHDAFSVSSLFLPFIHTSSPQHAPLFYTLHMAHNTTTRIVTRSLF
jgi:hypothetical protein